MTVYHVPLGTSFIPALAQGLIHRYEDDLSQLLVLLPTRRGCLTLKNTLMAQQKKEASFLPRIIALADLEEFPLLPGFFPSQEPLPALSNWQRQGILTKLVLAFEKQRLDYMSPAKATSLAHELMSLIDESATSNIDLKKIRTLVPEDYAEHWQLTLNFLTILTDSWPEILRNCGKIDAATRCRDHLLAIAKEWKPDYPVVLAGTTGTRPATVALAKSILSFQKGLVVLPGLDTFLPENLWNSLNSTHPQYPLSQFLKALETSRDQVSAWQLNSQNQKHHFLSLAMRPTLERIHKIPENIHFVPCVTQQEEAQSIALIVRKELEDPSKTIALITPDQGLVRQITAELKRWSIIPNNSAGTSLSQTVVGTFLLLTAAITHQIKPSHFLAILKHPLCRKSQGRFDHLCKTRSFEQIDLRASGKKFNVSSFRPSEAISDWYENIHHHFSPLLDLNKKRTSYPLAQWIEAHLRVSEDLSGIDLWKEEDGIAAQAFLTELLAEANHFPDLAASDYPEFLKTMMSAQRVRHGEGVGSRFLILGTLEARLQHADVTILASLNEGTWPAMNKKDPWLNRSMRIALGLPDPERRIGLSAHDFCLGFSAPCVYLTRSLKIDGSPTVASRWWQRLESIMPFHSNESSWAVWVRQLNTPKIIKNIQQPMPCPPVHTRPRIYTATDIATLMKDPYALYAKRILKIRPLRSLDEDLSAKDRGQLIHQAIDLFFRKHQDFCHPQALSQLLECGRFVFNAVLDRPLIQTFWWPRFERIAVWLVERWQQEAAEIEQTLTEVPAEIEISTPLGSVTLKTIADRVDLLTNGTIRILDYKTGQVPTLTSVSQGLSPQLPLESVIFQASTGRCASRLEYWALQGLSEVGKITSLKNVESLTQKAEEGVTNLIRTFSCAQTPYLSCPMGDDLSFNDYTHLERRQEWQFNL